MMGSWVLCEGSSFDKRYVNIETGEKRLVDTLIGKVFIMNPENGEWEPLKPTPQGDKK